MIPTPPRRRGVEYLDLPDVEPGLAERSIADVTVANRLFGGTRAVLAELAPVLAAGGPEATLLDVGTGLGDIPARARALAARRGVRLVTIGLDSSEELARASRRGGGWSVRGDAMRLPFAERSVDVVTCSQLLHHFTEADGAALLRELDRVARRRVIVSDLRRSYLAAAGFWVASWPLRFHRVTRHDGVVSVMRGFTAPELRALVAHGAGTTPAVRHRLGWRLTASWTPTDA
jgi:ubiquinone/menaquinone biosynthesis C-methylase UbiE